VSCWLAEPALQLNSDFVGQTSMKLREAREVPVESVPEVSQERVCIRWASGYWDGPMDGLADVDGRLVWFCIADEASEPAAPWCRRFWLVVLTSEQLARELARHADFQRYVGTHFDYDEQGRRDLSAQRPQSEWSTFYSKYSPEERDPGDLSENEVIGWFAW